MKDIYLDNGATSIIREEVLIEMLPYLKEEYGNPSTLYKLGRNSKTKIEKCRKQIAGFFNASYKDIFFTSGGTEANNWAILGVYFYNLSKKEKDMHIITSKIEHSSILNACKYLESLGVEVTYINVDKYGFVNVDDVKSAIKSNTKLISIMLVNNEVGTIQPIEEISKVSKKRNIILHTDAVAAAPYIEINVKALDVDLMSVSSHKLHGPKGCGFLYIKEGTKINPIFFGGEQERGKRAGTENVANIVGFTKAIEIVKENLNEETERLKLLQEKIINKLEETSLVSLNGSYSDRVYNNINLLTNVSADSIILNLDMQGIFISAGSACASGAIEASHVLLAMGLTEEASNNSIRITLGTFNTFKEIDIFIDTLINILNRYNK